MIKDGEGVGEGRIKQHLSQPLAFFVLKMAPCNHVHLLFDTGGLIFEEYWLKTCAGEGGYGCVLAAQDCHTAAIVLKMECGITCTTAEYSAYRNLMAFHVYLDATMLTA